MRKFWRWIVAMYLMPIHLKMVKGVKFMIRTFYHSNQASVSRAPGSPSQPQHRPSTGDTFQGLCPRFTAFSPPLSTSEPPLGSNLLPGGASPTRSLAEKPPSCSGPTPSHQSPSSLQTQPSWSHLSLGKARCGRSYHTLGASESTWHLVNVSLVYEPGRQKNHPPEGEGQRQHS